MKTKGIFLSGETIFRERFQKYILKTFSFRVFSYFFKKILYFPIEAFLPSNRSIFQLLKYFKYVLCGLMNHSDMVLGDLFSVEMPLLLQYKGYVMLLFPNLFSGGRIFNKLLFIAIPRELLENTPPSLFLPVSPISRRVNL